MMRNIFSIVKKKKVRTEREGIAGCSIVVSSPLLHYCHDLHISSKSNSHFFFVNRQMF